MQSIIEFLTPVFILTAGGLLTILVGLAIDAIRKALWAAETYLKAQVDKTDNEHLCQAARMAVAWVDQTLSTLSNPDKLAAAVKYLSDSLPFSATEKELIVAIEVAVNDNQEWFRVKKDLAASTPPVPPLVFPAVEIPASPLAPIS